MSNSIVRYPCSILGQIVAFHEQFVPSQTIMWPKRSAIVSGFLGEEAAHMNIMWMDSVRFTTHHTMGESDAGIVENQSR